MANLTIAVTNQNGEKLHDITLDEAVFGIEPNQQAMFDAVIMQQASLRQGTHDTKGRSEVKATGKKSIRQKGTGGARHAQKSAPNFVGGGVVFGPTPRKYGYKINRKVARLALRSYLSTLALEERIKVVDKLEMEEIKTKNFAEIMNKLGANRKALFVFDIEEEWENAWMSMRNIQEAGMEFADSISCLQLADAYTVVCTEAAIRRIEEGLK